VVCSTTLWGLYAPIPGSLSFTFWRLMPQPSEMGYWWSVGAQGNTLRPNPFLLTQENLVPDRMP